MRLASRACCGMACNVQSVLRWFESSAGFENLNAWFWRDASLVPGMPLAGWARGGARRGCGPDTARGGPGLRWANRCAGSGDAWRACWRRAETIRAGRRPRGRELAAWRRAGSAAVAVAVAPHGARPPCCPRGASAARPRRGLLRGLLRDLLRDLRRVPHLSGAPRARRCLVFGLATACKRQTRLRTQDTASDAAQTNAGEADEAIGRVCRTKPPCGRVEQGYQTGKVTRAGEARKVTE